MKELLQILALLCLIGLVMLFPSFVAKEGIQKTCSELRIANKTTNPAGILSSEDVKQYLSKNFHELVGQPLYLVPTDTLEEILEKNPYISDVEVYADINGTLFIDYMEEEPILRLFDEAGRSAYLSSNGRLLPLIHGFSLRTTIVSGNLGPWPNLGSKLCHEEHTLLTDIFELGQLLMGDAFYHNLIDQIHVDRRGEFTLVPRIGAHSISVGKPVDMAEKMENLKAFYSSGLSQGAWDRYSRISLKYRNQVVCTKR